nr:hypothetical protein [Tanacetum cinerariifolium]
MIGKGGYAEVYKGVLKNGEIVAVKQFTRGAIDERTASFLSELGAMAHVNHQNTAKLIGYGVEGGLHLVLELSPNGSLASWLHATLGKKLIIFDVNGMLADIVFPRPKDVEADKYSHRKEVFKRPYLDDFLSFCFDKFNVGIWSSRMKKNLDPVVDCLFGDLKKKLLFIWELRKVWEKTCRTWVKGTFNESNTLLLDDSPYKALLNPKHTRLIFPTSYKYTDTNDDYLGPTGALRAYLEGFAAADDRRTYVEQNPFGEGPIDEMNRYWKYYSRVLKCQMSESRDLDTNGTVHERPMKKPKFELRLPEGFLDPIICDKQQQPMVVVSPVSSTVGENGVRVNEKEKEIVSSLSKQFWKAGDYESCGNNSETVVPPETLSGLILNMPRAITLSLFTPLETCGVETELEVTGFD